MIAVGLFIAGILSLLIGGISLLQRKNDSIVYFFFLTTLGAASWAFGIALFLIADTTALLLFAASFYYIAAALIALSALLAGYVVWRRRMPTFKMALLISVPFLVITTVMINDPSVLLHSVTLSEQNTAALNSVPYVVYGAYFIFYYVAALALLFRGYKNASRVQKPRFGYFFGAYLFAGLIGMWFNLFLPGLGNYSLIWAGPLSVFLFILIVYVAIVRYGLFDIRTTLARTLSYALTLGALMVVYVGIGIIASTQILPNSLPGRMDALSAVLVLLLAMIFQPIKRFFDQVTNSIFFRNRYSRDDFYAELNSVLTRASDLQKLLTGASRVIAKTLSAEQAYFSVRHGDKIVNLGTTGHGKMTAADMDTLSKWWLPMLGDVKLLRYQLLDDSEENRSIRRLLLSYKATVVVCLSRDGVIIGFLVLGDRKSRSYEKRDLTVLETIADELVIAIENALSIQEIRSLNETLQQRIDDATSELRRSNAQLRKLDEAKDEFISMASHQLRTPLTSIKGYVDMILEGDAGEITPTQRKFLTEAFVSSERMVHLINDFLNVSRLQTGKFTIDKRPADLAKIVGQELDSLKISASGRDLAFRYKKPQLLPKLLLDEGKIRQVIMNFSDNALYYSRPGTEIKVSLEVEGEDVVLQVKDTGIGVPEEEQARLFTKFYRASNARKQRPDGTGVGLYLAKRVITEHGGSVVFSSVEGKGSTFGFRLPLERLRVRDDANQLDDKPDDK